MNIKATEPNIIGLEIEMSAAPIAKRPDLLMRSMPAGSTHWQLTLTRHGEAMTVIWSQGPGIKDLPSFEAVLSSLADDWASACQSYSEFCAEYGIESDEGEDDDEGNAPGSTPMESRLTWNAVQRLALDLERLFSDNEDFDAADLWEIVNNE